MLRHFKKRPIPHEDIISTHGVLELARHVATSISAKLFYMMTTLVLMTVVGMSVQSSTKFQSYLTQSIQDSSLQQAERAASDVSAVIDGWVGKLSVVLPKIDLKKSALEDKRSDDLAALIRNDRDILSVSVFVTEKDQVRSILKAKADHTDGRFEGEDPKLVMEKSFYQARLRAKELVKSTQPRDIFLKNLSPATGLPLLQIAVRFKVSGGEERGLFVIMTTWQTKLLLSLPKSRFTNTTMIDNNGDIFSSPDISEMKLQTNIKNSPLAKTALTRTAPSGFQDVYVDRKGVKRLGSFSQVSKYQDLYILVERDAAAAFRVISRTYFTAALWAALFILIAVMASYLGASTVTKSLRDLVSMTKEISSGNFGVRLQPRSNDEIAELGHSVNHMASRITELLSTQVEKARYEKELETARLVQSTFFPKQDVVKTPLTVTGFYQPATECGGDLWGHYNVDEHRQLVFIADVMGHGAPAALVTAIGYATCQAVATILNDEPGLDPTPSKLLDRLNRIIYDAVEGKISMTFFAALFDFKTGLVTYSNAGHNFPVVITNDKEDPRLSKQSKAKNATQPAQSISLILQGVPLGVDRQAVFKEKTIELRAGDRILFFTDGLIENHLPHTTAMERKKLLDIISQQGTGSCFEIKDIVLQEAFALFGRTNLADDVTVVVAEIDKSWSKSAASDKVEPAPIFLEIGLEEKSVV